MSNKFTGITSAGSAIPVYDKDAHSALGQKLDTSAFSSVSGEFATVDDVVAAVSGKADTSAIPSLDGYATEDYVYAATSGKANTEDIINYDGKPSANPIYAYGNEFYGVDSIAGSGVSINRSNLYLSGTVTANTGGFTANGISASNNDTYFCIKCGPEVISGGGGGGFTFSSQNTAFGTAQLTTAGSNQIVQMYSPKFEARNVSGAGFSIEGSGARGYDASGNVVWDTYNPPAPTQLIAGYDSPKPSILLSPYMPKTMSAQFSNAPLFSADGNGIYIGISGQYINARMQGITARNGSIRSEMSDNSGNVTAYSYLTGWDAGVYRSSAFGSAGSGTWSLTGSVQKREIECDGPTSAITAIAGSAIGGKEYSAGANIDITDEVISGKDWSDEIVAATSGLQPSGDYLSASESANFYPMTGNPSGFLTEHQSLDGLMQTSGLEYDGDKISGYMGSAFAGGGEVPEGVMVESAVGYNAVNEISGYNGSAIAQYGAEKQWLVHDDTLVHAANSAQYALGVNVSALQRLMGIDETVLYNNTAATTADVAIGSTFNVNEPITNFNKFKIYFSRFPVTSNGGSNGGPCSQIREYDSTACSAYFVINETFPTSTAQNPDWFDISMLIETISGTTWKCKACYQSKLPSGALDRGWTYLKPYKVIGIGRISG